MAGDGASLLAGGPAGCEQFETGVLDVVFHGAPSFEVSLDRE
jgi:hypothetical protein